MTTALTRRPRAVLFDWDNTLVDTWPAIHDALNHTLVAFGHAGWTLGETKARVRKSMRDSFPALFGDRWQEAGETFYRRFAERHLETLIPRPGAADLLTALKDGGAYLGVVSNKKGDILRREANHLGWQGYFGRLVGAFDAARDKPARDPIDLALSGSGVSCGRDVWFVGDTEIDMECARTAGCVAVLVLDESYTDDFARFPPDGVFGDCRALCSHVRTL
jgi:phosphoglycolate phosphatase